MAKTEQKKVTYFKKKRKKNNVEKVKQKHSPLNENNLCEMQLLKNGVNELNRSEQLCFIEKKSEKNQRKDDSTCTLLTKKMKITVTVFKTAAEKTIILCSSSDDL